MSHQDQPKSPSSPKGSSQSLAQLQAEWRAIATKDKEPDSVTYMLKQCADALQPHVEREAAAQAKSLADERRIADKDMEIDALLTNLAAERTRRLAAEDIVDRSLAHFPEKKLRALAHGYRTQYPRVGEEQ